VTQGQGPVGLRYNSLLLYIFLFFIHWSFLFFLQCERILCSGHGPAFPSQSTSEFSAIPLSVSCLISDRGLWTNPERRDVSLPLLFSIGGSWNKQDGMGGLSTSFFPLSPIPILSSLHSFFRFVRYIWRLSDFLFLPSFSTTLSGGFQDPADAILNLLFSFPSLSLFFHNPEGHIRK